MNWMAALALAANVIWAPQPGSQALFMSCPIRECLIEGTKGGGKTDVLLMDYAQHIGAGFGDAWRGILFRRTFPELADVIAKSRKWFHQIFPDATYNQSEHTWTFATGEQLLLRFLEKPSDYWRYHGHEYPWQGWEELCAWPSLESYDAMQTCCRSSTLGVPKKIRATANPFGPGHNAVKRRFIDPAPAGVPITDSKSGQVRVRLRSSWRENLALLAASPDYPKTLAGDRNANRRKAWFDGSWDVVSGGMLDDLWDANVHVLAGKLAWAPRETPIGWKIRRTLDWGSAKPFSNGWHAESDGSPAPNGKPYARGSVFRVAEWYGWDGENANVGAKLTDRAVAEGIVAREKSMGIHDRVKPGPADSSIFFAEPGKEAIADVMRKAGAPFEPAPKKPGSRRSGWETIRRYLEASAKWAEACAASSATPKMEQPGYYVMETCRDGFLRTVPVLPRDEKDPEDVDTDAEDHTGDEVRYALSGERWASGNAGGFTI